MRLKSLLPRLSFIIAVFPSSNHRSEDQQEGIYRHNSDTSATATTTTSAPSPLDLAARTGGFTDPLIPTQPTIFYDTATGFHVISGVTVFTTYTDLISGTVAIPFTGSTELDLSALPTASTSLTIAISVVFPVEPSVPSGSPTPTLNLGACSTATAGDGAQACENSLIGSFNGVYGVKTSSSSGSEDVSGKTRAKVTPPTNTIMEPYLGAVVAKGEATWAVGAQANGGLREMDGGHWKLCSLIAGLGGVIVVAMFR